MGEAGGSLRGSSIGPSQLHTCLLVFVAGVFLYTLYTTWAQDSSSSSSSSSSNSESTPPHTISKPQQQWQQAHAGGAGGRRELEGGPAHHAPAAAAAAAAEVVRLQQQYAGMARGFSEQGLDLAAIADTAKWFDTGSDAFAPLFYQHAAFPPAPLPPAAVRLLLVLLSQAPPPANPPTPTPTAAAPAAAAAAAAAAADPAAAALNATAVAVSMSIIQQVQALLPHGYKVYANPPHGLHITLFHFSHPLDTRPDSLTPPPHGSIDCPQHSSSSSSSGDSSLLKPTKQLFLQYEVAADATAAAQAAAGQDTACIQQQQQQQQQPAHLRPGPTQQQLHQERQAAAAVAAQAQPFTLELDRVLLARGGTLLLGWRDPSGGLGRLRQALHTAFPGASSKQSSIIHTSLLRIVSTPQQQQQQQLAPGVVSRLSRLCEALTQQHRGMRLAVGQVHWVVEEQFSTVQGEQVPMPLAASEAGAGVV